MNIVAVRFDKWALNFFLFFSLFFYRLSLDVAYIFVVYPVFNYLGFELNVTPLLYFVSWAVLLICFPFLSINTKRLSDFVFLLAFLSLMVPISSYYGLTGQSIYPLFLTFLSFITFFFLTRRLFLSLIPDITRLTEGRMFVKLFSFVLLFFLVIWYFYSGAVKYINFDITKVYEFRDLSAEVANVGLLSYLNSWIYQVFSLFLLSVFLLERRFFLVFLIFAIQVFFFGVTSHKSLLFYPFVILGVWFYFRHWASVWWLPLMLAIIVLFSLALYFLVGNVWPVSLFVRRVLFVPADLTYDYISFFKGNDFVFWSNSILSSFVEYPYEKSVPNLIGEYNESGAAANNGFVSSGYANAGLAGVLFYTFVFSFFVLAIERFTKELPLWFSIAVSIIPIRTAIVSSDLFTVILTHGLLLTLVLVLLFRARRVELYN